MATTISVSILNIVVSAAIIVGCIYAMYRLIKKCKTTEEIKDSQNHVIGYKKKGSILITIFFMLFLICILAFASFIVIMHIFNIILIS